MKKWDPENIEFTTRDLLSIGIMTEVVEGRGSPAGGVYLSFAHLPKNIIEFSPKWYGKPFLTEDWTFKGMNYKDLIREVMDGRAIEIGPASHFFMGGIRVDERGATTLEGLYAAGEVSGGVHGANRLSGNACTQIVVQGRRAGAAAAEFASSVDQLKFERDKAEMLKQDYNMPLERKEGIRPYEIKNKMHKISWEKVGILRSGEGLKKALEEIQQIWESDIPRVFCQNKDQIYNREWMEALQIRNLLTVLKAVALSAQARTESRGAHYRKDFPKMNNREWLKNMVVGNNNGEMTLSTSPVVITRFRPPEHEV